MRTVALLLKITDFGAMAQGQLIDKSGRAAKFFIKSPRGMLRALNREMATNRTHIYIHTERGSSIKNNL
ncbi:MAG: hypothetical protein DRO67_08320 [Candidatus Asgardarchaeum californiense]|nr:MAG: hypothetical protein DRO67_08320 [Candidatus Asgardarchaeum californiense]